MNDKAIALIPCPDFEKYPEALKDQSHSTLVDCPKCKSKMWLSEKKKEAISFCLVNDKNIILACYPCMTEIASERSRI